MRHKPIFRENETEFANVFKGSQYNNLKYFIMKNLLNLNGAQVLSKNEKMNINGGGVPQCLPGSCEGCETVTEYACCLGFGICD